MNINTHCIACGTRLPNGDHFCDGYRGGYDTYQCQCDCHWQPTNRFYETGRHIGHR